MYQKDYDDTSIVSILEYAEKFTNRSLRDVMSDEVVGVVSDLNLEYGVRRKGNFGNLVEKYIFGYKPNSDSNADFHNVNVELKTTPLKKLKNGKLVSKERLVFSMIDYMTIVEETWENSSFLKKNRLLLLMFYLYESGVDILDYKFEIIRLFDLLSDISESDILQMRSDWETIVNKIRAGKAHLLSEADTSYLGAATKASNSSVRREQPFSTEGAKPRAFSLKQSFLNYLIQGSLEQENMDSILKKDDRPQTIEELVDSRLKLYIGKEDVDIQSLLGISFDKKPKNYRRMLVNRMLGVKTNKIEELEKANITLKVITLETTGRLVESISFPIFRYMDIVNEEWESSGFYEQLTTRRFMFVVFRKTEEGKARLEKVQFWNFPLEDIEKARAVWQETVDRINDCRCDNLPKIRESEIAHVRPHARNSEDTLPTPCGRNEVKKCFWLNAKYIEKQLQY